MFTGKVERFSASVQLLRDSLTQLREAYQAALDYNLNRVIKLLTVLATIYLPPTLIAGWYGMKREHIHKLLLRAAQQDCIPIINYNDPVSDEENRKMELASRRMGTKPVMALVASAGFQFSFTASL